MVPPLDLGMIFSTVLIIDRAPGEISVLWSAILSSAAFGQGLYVERCDVIRPSSSIRA